MDAAVQVNAIDAGEGDFPQFLGKAQVGVGEVDDAVAAADDIVGFVEAFAVPAVGDGGYIAGGVHTGEAAVVGALAHQQVALPVEGAAVAFAGVFPDYGGDARFRLPAQQLLAFQIHEGEVAGGVPEGAFGAFQRAVQQG